MNTTNIYKNLWFAVLLAGLLCAAPSPVSPPYIALPVSVANGGTGGTTSATARAGISAARNDAGQTLTGDQVINGTTSVSTLTLNNSNGAPGILWQSTGALIGQIFPDSSGNLFLYVGPGANTLGLKLPAGGGIALTSGANGRAGTFTLVSGTKVVSNTSVTANSVILPTIKTASGTRAGVPDCVPTPGVGFTATGAATDNGTYNFVVIEVN